jgi:hypothetical protein
LNASLAVAAGRTEILVARATRQASRRIARLAYAGYYEVAEADAAHIIADIDDFSQRFVSQNIVIGAVGRSSEPEGAEFAVGPADTDFEHPEFELSRRGDGWLGVIDESHFAGTGEYAYSSHAVHLSANSENAPTREAAAARDRGKLIETR